jgi:hypothetical protein
MEKADVEPGRVDEASRVLDPDAAGYVGEATSACIDAASGKTSTS